jgi:uncharacterized protein
MEINTNTNFPSWIKQSIGFLLAVFLLLLVMDKGYDVFQNIKPSTPKNTLSMSAEGKVTAKPDLATVNVGVVSVEKTAKEAQDENTKSTNKIIDTVKKLGIPEADIVTSNFSVYPNYTYDGRQNEINGYQATQTLTIKVRKVDQSTDTLGKILSQSVDNGSNQIQGVYFSFDDPDNLRQQARKLAIDKAKQKAMDLAAASGLRLGKVVTISESSGYTPYPIAYPTEADKGFGGGVASPTPQIQPGSQDVTAQMTVVFEIK